MKIIEGHVLKTQDFADQDKIVTFFSKECGLISLVCLGTRKIASKNKYGLELYSTSTLEVFKSNRQKLGKLKKANLVKARNNLNKSYFNYILATIVSDVTLAFFEIDEKSFEYYLLLELLLNRFDQNIYPLKSFAIYFYRALKYAGAFWELNVCSICGKKISFAQYFDSQSYGVLCEDDFSNFDNRTHIINNQLLLENLKKIASSPVKEIFAINLETDEAILLIKVLFTYYEFILGVSTYGMKTLAEEPIFINKKTW